MKMQSGRKQALKLAVAITLILGGGAVSATPISIANFSFENIAFTDGHFSIGAATGWVNSGNSGAWNPTIGQMKQGPTNGFQVGFSNQKGLGLSQTLSATLMANIQYTLMVDVLSRTDGFFHKSSILELRTADDNILASASIGVIAAGSNGLLTVKYLASASDPNLGKNLKIALIAGGPQSDWDNVRLDATGSTSTVSEPTVIWLFGLGLLGLCGMKKVNLTA